MQSWRVFQHVIVFTPTSRPGVLSWRVSAVHVVLGWRVFQIAYTMR